MRYRVRHLTRYEYGAPVDLAAHIVHLMPRSFDGQRVISSVLHVDPLPVRQVSGADHFGNLINWIFHEAPHDQFTITALSDVEVRPPASPTTTPPWEEILNLMHHPDVQSWKAVEFTLDGPGLGASALAAEYVQKSFTPGRPIFEAVFDLTRRIYTEFRFRAGVTSLHTSVDEVLKRREGVCQDFTNMMISGLRWMGLPARYMSGYIRTYRAKGQEKMLGADQSHAWVGVWMGPQGGWIGFDPTNGILARDEHVVLGWGREYSDISPVRGMILGGGNDKLRVEVDLLPVGTS